MDVVLGFAIITLLAADTPTPTSPKSTVPGVTRTRASEADTGTPDPQPDVDTIKQQTAARTKAVHRPSKLRGRVVGPDVELVRLSKVTVRSAKRR
jgi:hypothetical protein